MSTLNKISLNGTTYDISGGDANIYDIYIDTGELYYQYTCVDPEALKTCTKILASLSSGKPAFVFLKNKNNAYCQGLCAKEPITVTPGKGGTVDFTGWAGAVLYDSLYQSGYNRAKIDKPTFGFRYNEQGEATGIRFYFSSADISYIPTDGNFKTAFSPTQPYHPVTKKYVDDSIKDSNTVVPKDGTGLFGVYAHTQSGGNLTETAQVTPSMVEDIKVGQVYEWPNAQYLDTQDRAVVTGTTKIYYFWAPDATEDVDSYKIFQVCLGNGNKYEYYFDDTNVYKEKYPTKQ